MSICQEWIAKSGLPITSVSLKPMDFGKNIVVNLEPCVLSMFKQILIALENSQEDYVFFCEHDVLYHTSHFQFSPPQDDTFYYNTNVWKCHPRKNYCMTYDHLRSISGICVNRKLAVDHYRKRMEYIYNQGFDKIPGRNPKWARKMGYEPGKKFIDNFSEDRIEEWKAEWPNIDVHHQNNITPLKMSLEDFKRKPTNFIQTTIDKIPGWDLTAIFL